MHPRGGAAPALTRVTRFARIDAQHDALHDLLHQMPMMNLYRHEARHRHESGAAHRQQERERRHGFAGAGAEPRADHSQRAPRRAARAPASRGRRAGEMHRPAPAHVWRSLG
ncbi:hypothetical protein WL40_05005 [Burkholderia ubonensis]|nr:hypothetical protein WJ73_12140 [Burkholderia ubonensis]KVO40798.1 hypothetical protein WJ76_06450 [Burkholderia ubonensis]KVP76072.1 hypothetical protein WJ92_22775 [Burkholderia ubonensis]KVQ75604.1 hypothetical protein WK05_08090 [Burkholderia ubonensis]KVU92625.1 hypothetical protein WK75_01180 [Burkholderia ubonensis]